MSNKMIKAIYSPSLCLRYEEYEDGVRVGFSNPRQTEAVALEFVYDHVNNETDPYEFGIDTPENDAAHIASVDDWVTLYEADA